MTTETRATSAYYSIDTERLEAVQALLADTTLTPDAIEAYLLADWDEGETHQTWMDTAPVTEIANWVLGGHDI